MKQILGVTMTSLVLLATIDLIVGCEGDSTGGMGIDAGSFGYGGSTAQQTTGPEGGSAGFGGQAGYGYGGNTVPTGGMQVDAGGSSNDQGGANAADSGPDGSTAGSYAGMGGADASGVGGAAGAEAGVAGGEAGVAGAEAGAAGAEAGAAGGAGVGGNDTFELGCPDQKQNGTPTNIWVVGDSTAAVYEPSVIDPRVGWAQEFQPNFATECATVQDKAISGRSSKSFYDEGAWTPIVAAIKPGDYVLIQFGHNDEKTSDPTKFTDPATTFPEYLTKYITESEAKGAVPILLTPISRENWNGNTITDSHGEYDDAIRTLASTQNVPLVDATTLTATYLEKVGKTEAATLYNTSYLDTTHLVAKGAKIVAQIVAADMYRQKLPIASLLAAVPTEP